MNSSTDYYPFGMQMPARNWNSSYYRYGFNGKENDNDVKGPGNQIDYGARIYDPRIGKFLSIDPLTKKYSELTPYQFASNTSIQASDIDGLEANFQSGKLPKEKYIPNLPKILQLENFKNNIATSAYNSVIQNAEDITNLFNSKGRDQVVLRMSNSLYNAFQFRDLPLDQQWNSTKKYFSDVDHLEDFLGGIAAGEIEGVFIGGVSQFTKNIFINFGELNRAKAVFNIDLMGGVGKSRYGKNWTNFDLKSYDIAGDVKYFSNYFKKNSVAEIIADNPQATFLNEVNGSLKKGGTITVRGNLSTKYFREIYDGKAKGIENYTITEINPNVPNKGYKKTTGENIQGEIHEVILKKK